MFNRLLDIVAYSHGMGVVHRDLKPANILGKHGELRVLIGVARYLDEHFTQADDIGYHEFNDGDAEVSLERKTMATRVQSATLMGRNSSTTRRTIAQAPKRVMPAVLNSLRSRQNPVDHNLVHKPRSSVLIQGPRCESGRFRIK